MKLQRVNLDDRYLAIQNQYQVSELCAKVLAFRQVNDQQIQQLLSTDLTLSKSNCPAMETIIARLQQAKTNHEKVLIAGDYDADGLCATAIMKEALDLYGVENGFYIPHRLNEGYGLSTTTVQLAKEKGYSLLITVDNGVAAQSALALAKQVGIDVIVTDHHVIVQEPECLVTLHPDRMEEQFQSSCGAGIALAVFNRLHGLRKRPIMLAAIATIADMMPLWNENRVLVRLGLKFLNERQFTAIEQLMDRKVELWTEKEIAYQIVPKLNAAGRLAEQCNVNNIVRYLICNDLVSIETMSSQIKQLNQTRRQMSEKMTKTALSMIDEEDCFHIIASEEFHEGIVGLIAGKIANETKRPTLVLAENKTGYKGSLRSVPGLDLQEFFNDLQPYLLNFGGHSQAAGIEVEKSQFELLKMAILTKMKQNDYQVEEVVKEVLPISLKQISLSGLHELDRLAPFGQQFESVLFEISDFTILQYTKMKEIYPKWKITDGNEILEAISFDRLQDNPTAHSLIGTLQINRYLGNEKCSVLVESTQ